MPKLMRHGGDYDIQLLQASAASREAKTDSNGVVHFVHLLLIQASHVFPKAAFIDGPDLFQKNDGIFTQANAPPRNVDVGRQPGFSCLAGNGSRNDGG